MTPEQRHTFVTLALSNAGLVRIDGGEPGDEQAREWVRRARRTWYTCPICNKCLLYSAFSRDSIGLDMCIVCYDEAGMENEHQDGYHAEQPKPDVCPMCRAQ